jgi:hypothetical protein
MSDPIRPDALLRQARVLAGFGAGRGRPKTIDHRRAVSAAYYALYHRLIDACVDLMFPKGIPESARHAATRWFDHGDIAEVCRWVLKVAIYTKPQAERPQGIKDNGVWELFSTPASGGRRSAVPFAVRFTADAFVTLQQARHDADYDHSASFPKAVARTHVLTAVRAINLIEQNQASGRYMRRFLAMNVARASRLKRG